MKVLAILCLAFAVANAQKTGQQPNYDYQLDIETCTKSGGCQTEEAYVTMDSNWRWTHAEGIPEEKGNCYNGNLWNTDYCPDPATCTENCVLEGLKQNEWEETYGITFPGNGMSFKFVTEGPYSTNIGGRAYMLDNGKQQYRMFNLLNKEFTFDVDDHNLPCGLNGALYFVEMEQDGGKQRFPTNECGAEYGTGYCDAQCPHDMKWINGEANCEDWEPSDNDQNAGTGKYGICCAEMDIWEGNSKAQAFTTHPCSISGYYRCEGTECGDNDSDERYDGVCDKDGCDFASYRLGDPDFYGDDGGKKVDASQPFTVVTQFITSDGTDNGDLVEVRRKYVQNGQVIENSKVNFDGVQEYDSITDQMCDDVKVLFGDTNDHKNKGGLKKMGDAMKNGMVLVMSMWDDHEARMLWLDSAYPPDGDITKPGVLRGPCPTDSGEPSEVEDRYKDATVVYSNIRFGEIDSTY